LGRWHEQKQPPHRYFAPTFTYLSKIDNLVPIALDKWGKVIEFMVEVKDWEALLTLLRDWMPQSGCKAVSAEINWFLVVRRFIYGKSVEARLFSCQVMKNAPPLTKQQLELAKDPYSAYVREWNAIMWSTASIDALLDKCKQLGNLGIDINSVWVGALKTIQYRVHRSESIPVLVQTIKYMEASGTVRNLIQYNSYLTLHFRWYERS